MTLFNRRQIDSAIKVLAETDLVKNWASGELKAYGMSIDTPAGQKFYDEKRLEQAQRIISTAK